MNRTRISTTVATDRITQARQLADWRSDAELIDAALAALLAQHRTTQVDKAYVTAYRAHPVDEPDEWGDLGSFRDAASRT